MCFTKVVQVISMFLIETFRTTIEEMDEMRFLKMRIQFIRAIRIGIRSISS